MSSASSQSLSDLKSLFTNAPPEEQITARLVVLNNEIQELKKPLREAAQLFALKKDELTRLDTRRKYLPGDRKLGKARKLLAAEVAELELNLKSLKERSQFAHTEHDRLLLERRQRELIEESKDSPFIIPDQDPLVALVVAAAICESLQYQYVSGSRYYHWLIDQCSRGADGEVARGDTDNSAGVPEIENQWNDKLDDMRARREYLMTLRISAERTFLELLPRLPADAPFKPKMLRRSDEELEAQLEQRNAAKWQAKQAERRAVGSAEHDHARKEDKIYKPMSTAPKGVNPRL